LVKKFIILALLATLLVVDLSATEKLDHFFELVPKNTVLLTYTDSLGFSSIQTEHRLSSFDILNIDHSMDNLRGVGVTGEGDYFLIGQEEIALFSSSSGGIPELEYKKSLSQIDADDFEVIGIQNESDGAINPNHYFDQNLPGGIEIYKLGLLNFKKEGNKIVSEHISNSRYLNSGDCYSGRFYIEGLATVDRCILVRSEYLSDLRILDFIKTNYYKTGDFILLNSDKFQKVFLQENLSFYVIGDFPDVFPAERVGCTIDNCIFIESANTIDLQKTEFLLDNGNLVAFEFNEYLEGGSKLNFKIIAEENGFRVEIT
jgi:hypothetical protein